MSNVIVLKIVAENCSSMVVSYVATSWSQGHKCKNSVVRFSYKYHPCRRLQALTGMTEILLQRRGAMGYGAAYTAYRMDAFYTTRISLMEEGTL